MPTAHSPPTSSPSLSFPEHGQRTDAGADGGATSLTASDCATGNSNSVSGANIPPALGNADGPENLTSLIISIQSLLGQFALPKVRAAFLDGKFHRQLNIKLLPKIDELRCSLFPRWRDGSLTGAASSNAVAANHLHLLAGKWDDKFITNLEDVQGALTYSEWYNILNQLAEDPYWRGVQPSQRCVHVLPVDIDDNQSAATMSDQQSTATSVNRHEKKSTTCKQVALIKKEKQQPVQQASSIRRKTQSRRTEEIIISSSDNESEINYTEDSSSDTGSDEYNMTQRSRRPRQRRHRERREVVTPPVFVMDGRLPLKNFFATYEEYFYKKYDGNNHDMTQTLSTFLTGELLEIFVAKGGRRLKYSRMKEELLAYYRKQKIGGRTYWRSKLETAVPQPQENYNVFGAKLVEIAELAYPGNKKESAIQVRKQFLKSVPSHIASKVEESELTLLAGGKSQRMSFEKMVQFAQGFQRSTESSSRQLMLVSSTSTSIESNRLQSQVMPCPNCSVNRAKVGVDRPVHQEQRGTSDSVHHQRSPSSRSFTNSGNNSRSQVTCGYCKKPNHTTGECWRAARRCLICGGNHHFHDCRRYNPQYRSGSEDRVAPRLN